MILPALDLSMYMYLASKLFLRNKAFLGLFSPSGHASRVWSWHRDYMQPHHMGFLLLFPNLSPATEWFLLSLWDCLTKSCVLQCACTCWVALWHLIKSLCENELSCFTPCLWCLICHFALGVDNIQSNLLYVGVSSVKRTLKTVFWQFRRDSWQGSTCVNKGS